MVLGWFDNFPRHKLFFPCNLGLFLRSVKWVGLRVVTSVNRYSFLSCTHLEWLWMKFNFHPFFGQATDRKKLRVKGRNLSQVTIMRSNWGRLIVIFVTLGTVLILSAQINQILQVASHKCDL